MGRSRDAIASNKILCKRPFCCQTETEEFEFKGYDKYIKNICQVCVKYKLLVIECQRHAIIIEREKMKVGMMSFGGVLTVSRIISISTHSQKARDAIQRLSPSL